MNETFPAPSHLSLDPRIPTLLTVMLHLLIPRRIPLLPILLLLVFAGCLGAFKVTGALGGVDSVTGARPLRYEIHEFANSGAAFDLVILSLIAFQGTNQSDPRSYFQISGCFLHICIQQRLTFDQASMASPESLGMESWGVAAIQDTACMPLFLSRSGIDHTWHFLR